MKAAGMSYWQVDVQDAAPDMVGCRFRVHLHPLVQHHISAVRLGTKPKLAHSQHIKLKFYNFQLCFPWRLLGCPIDKWMFKMRLPTWWGVGLEYVSIHLFNITSRQFDWERNLGWRILKISSWNFIIFSFTFHEGCWDVLLTSGCSRCGSRYGGVSV